MTGEREIWQRQQYGTTWKGVGLYHITLVIPDRQSVLGRLVIPNNDPTLAKVEVLPLGHALLDYQRTISDYHPEIQLLHYCLMPDHLHMIWYVRQTMPRGIASAVRGFWQGVKKAGRAYSYLSLINSNDIREKARKMEESTRMVFGRNEERALGELVTDSLTKSQIQDISKMLQGQLGDEAYYQLAPIFTEMPHIQAMGHRSQLPTTIRYIDMNPQRLATKRIKPDYLRVQRGIDIAGRLYDGVGNVAILQADRYAPVHVRRKMVEAAERGDDERLREYMNACVLAARQGVVMVSPFISPKEKEVLSVLMREKRKIIFLIDKPMGEYYKPVDGLFDACAAGRILILSPATSDYKPEKDERPYGSHRITRNTCVALNKLAEEICGGGRLE